MTEINAVDESLGGDDLADTDEGAKILGVAPVTLKNSRYTSRLGDAPAPEYLKIGKNVRYSKRYLEQVYLPSCRIVPAAAWVNAR